MISGEPTLLLLNITSITGISSRSSIPRQLARLLKMSVRRSGRRRNPVAFEPDSCYPDAPPCTEFERIVAKLDLEAFPSSNFARIDDVLTYALFATKRSPRNYRALVPTRAFLDGNPPLTKAEALDINNFYVSIRDCPATLTVAAQLTKYLKDKYPSIIMDGTDERAAKQ